MVSLIFLCLEGVHPFLCVCIVSSVYITQKNSRLEAEISFTFSSCNLKI